MDKLASALVEALQIRMSDLSSEERVAIIASLQSGYCAGCGDNALPCQCPCWNEK